ncbi:bola protein [Rhodocollybia butyracea]|uniref:Bola protein n=1 Tax=Rhodocollybia butyracea TaxID=206335 RepID=A0A9P5Q1Q7_9AGAR|nr:bola protein [Rhodocollybia butyracea]
MFSVARRHLLPTVSRARRFSAAPDSRTEGERLITTKLTEKFRPSALQVQDTSGGCGTFYSIHIASEAFKGLPMVKQHRLVTETLKEEIEGIHGLQIKTSVQEGS